MSAPWPRYNQRFRGLSPRRWAQPSTADAPILVKKAAITFRPAITSIEFGPTRATDTTAFLCVISEGFPRCEIQIETKVNAYANSAGTAAVMNPETGLNPAT